MLDGMYVTPLVPMLVGSAAVLAWRVREAQTPVTLKKILIAPLGMSTGLAMFALPMCRIPWSWALGAFAAGALLFSYPMVRSSHLHREGDHVMMRRSKAFLWVFFGIVATRLALRSYFDTVLTPPQTGGLFFLLAFGMILGWRGWMLLQYRRLTRQS